MTDPRIAVVLFDAADQPYGFAVTRLDLVSTSLRSGAETWRLNTGGWNRVDDVPPLADLPEPDLAPR